MTEDDLKPWQKIKIPTDEQVERATAVLRQIPGAIPEGFTPRDNMIRPLLAILMNQDLILGLDRP